MHLWPSMRIRDSFKIAYLKKLEWNLHRMNSDKKQPQQSSTSNNNQEKLLVDNTNTDQVVEEDKPISRISCLAKAGFICGEILMIFSCCYCCFCCGACVDQED